MTIFGRSHFLYLDRPVMVGGRKDTIPAWLVGLDVNHRSTLNTIDIIDIKDPFSGYAKESHHTYRDWIWP